MNIEKLVHDLRARINPQYYDQIGTESYERHQVVMALESLREENERLRFDILAMNQSLDLLRDENARIRENAKTIGELEQLATRSNNNMLVEIEQLREQAENDSVQIELLEHKLESFKDENELLKNDAERYRWLRDYDYDIGELFQHIQAHGLTDTGIDAAIDAARGGK